MKPSECQCGYMFCCGEILRRLELNILVLSDTFFFDSKVGPIKISIGMIAAANAAWYAKPRPSEVADEDKVIFLRQTFRNKTELPRSSTLFNSFVKEGMESRPMAHYMSCILPSNEK